ncbi:MAG: ABC transporter substrate-binding protein, partial [Gammaproteobacteria bacterium]
ERARADAEALGYGFTSLKRETLREGASTYRELLGELESPVDALWLPQGSPFVAESSVLQMILRAAWDRNIVVFSSNVSHVPKGALFALFPDNAEMGRALGRLAADGKAPAGLQVLEQLDTAINIRTANHLGLGLSAGDTRFDMIFPSR